MAIARVQNASGGTATGSTSLGVAWPAATMAGNLLVAVLQVRCYGSTVQPITPPAGWSTAIINESDLGSSAIGIFYIENAASRSGTETFTWTGDKGAALTLIEYSGMASSAVLDQTAGSPDESGVAAAWTGTTATTTQAEEVWVAGLAHDNNEVFGAPTNGFTQVDQRTALGTSPAQPTQTMSAEKIVSATGTATTSATITGASRLSTGAIATFRAVPPPAAPVNTAVPVISGTAQVGQTLTSSDGTWTGEAPITFEYQWRRGLTNIAGATSSSYTLVADDLGQSITCRVTATNAGGSTPATSDPVVPTAAPAPPANLTPPTIDAARTQTGDTLTATDGTWSGDEPITFTYQWTRDNVDIVGATGQTYQLDVLDETHSIRVVVTATNGVGSDSATSDPIIAQAAPPPPPPPGDGPPSVGRPGVSNPGGSSVGAGAGIRTL